MPPLMSGSPQGRRRSVGIVPAERRACDIPRSTTMLRANLTLAERHELLGWEGDTVHPTPFTKSDEARAQAMLKEEREKLRSDLMKKEEMKQTQLSLVKAANKEEFKQRQKDRESTLKKEAEVEKKTRESERTYYQNAHGATFMPDTSPGMRRSGSPGSFRSPSTSSRRARKAAESDSKDGEDGAAGDGAPAMRRPPSSPGGAPESPN